MNKRIEYIIDDNELNKVSGGASWAVLSEPENNIRVHIIVNTVAI